DPVSDTWTTAGVMTSPSAGQALLLPNGKVLVARSFNPHDNSFGFTADLFDPVTGRFQAAPGISFEYPPGPYVAMELLADGRVLLAGGAVNKIYDPSTAALSDVPPADRGSTARHVRLLPNGRVLVNAIQVIHPLYPPTSYVFFYDPRTNTMTASSL